MLEVIEQCYPTKRKLVKCVIEDQSGFDMSNAASVVYLTHKGVMDMQKATAAKQAEDKKLKLEKKTKREEEKEKT